MALVPTTSDLPALSPPRRVVRHRAGVALLLAGTCGYGVWFAWRVLTLDAHVIPIAAALLELIGAACGVVVALALSRRTDVRTVHGGDERDPRRFAFAVADLVGRTRAEDVRRDLRTFTGARRATSLSLADMAVASVLVDGPRRLTLVGVAVVGLLLGVSPLPVPSPIALVGLLLGVACVALATVVFGEGRIAPGDRLRWTYASLGELVVRDDLAGVAPRRWVGTVATIVVVDIAVALRGMSDRWTHGLPPMDDDARVVAMVLAMTLVAGALYTLATTPAPQLDNPHLVSRRLEERTARQSALGAAMCVAVIGLVAGILPGCVDPADDDATRIEHVRDGELGTAVDD